MQLYFHVFSCLQTFGFRYGNSDLEDHVGLGSHFAQRGLASASPDDNGFVEVPRVKPRTFDLNLMQGMMDGNFNGLGLGGQQLPQSHLRRMVSESVRVEQ